EKLASSLTGYRSATMPMLEQVEGANGPYDNQQTFEQQALCLVDRNVRIYSATDFPGEVIIPEEYAAALDAVRTLRMTALQSAVADSTGAQQGFATAEAQAALAQNQYRNRLLPEELVYYLKELPDRGYFTRVFLLDYGNPRDLWLRQIY